MNSRVMLIIRGGVIFWICMPLLVFLFFLVFVELGGRWVGPNAEGPMVDIVYAVVFLAWVTSFLAAHIVMLAALLGLASVIGGMCADWKLVSAVLVGLTAGGALLSRIYF